MRCDRVPTVVSLISLYMIGREWVVKIWLFSYLGDQIQLSRVVPSKDEMVYQCVSTVCFRTSAGAPHPLLLLPQLRSHWWHVQMFWMSVSHPRNSKLQQKLQWIHQSLFKKTYKTSVSVLVLHPFTCKSTHVLQHKFVTFHGINSKQIRWKWEGLTKISPLKAFQFKRVSYLWKSL